MEARGQRLASTDWMNSGKLHIYQNIEINMENTTTSPWFGNIIYLSWVLAYLNHEDSLALVLWVADRQWNRFIRRVRSSYNRWALAGNIQSFYGCQPVV